MRSYWNWKPPYTAGSRGNKHNELFPCQMDSFTTILTQILGETWLPFFPQCEPRTWRENIRLEIQPSGYYLIFWSWQLSSICSRQIWIHESDNLYIIPFHGPCWKLPFGIECLYCGGQMEMVTDCKWIGLDLNNIESFQKIFHVILFGDHGYLQRPPLHCP